MIEVLHLIDAARIGGPGKTIINSARFIDHGRYRVHVGAFTHPDPVRSEFANAAVAAGIPFLDLPETRRVDPTHPVRIRAYLRTHRIGLVHAHGYRSDVLCWMATRGMRVALVTTHHGWIRNNWRQRLFTRYAAALSGRFEGVEVVSLRLLEDLPDRIRRSGRAEVVHNAIVLDDYGPVGARTRQRRELGVESGDFLLGVVGRLSIEKGCLEMVETFRLLAARCATARLVFVGEGPLEPRIRREVEASGLGHAVRFLPHLRDVRPLYEALDILVCPSRTEGLSNVIMEAMAYARPVVATRVGGNPEVVDDGVTGVLVPAEQPQALADVLAVLAADPARCRQLGEAGKARVRTDFSFEVRMRKEEAFYERALARVGR